MRRVGRDAVGLVVPGVGRAVRIQRQRGVLEIGRVARHAVIAHQTQLLRHRVVTRCDDAALAHRRRLHRVEGEHRHVRMPAGPHHSRRAVGEIASSQRVAGILDHRGAARFGDVGDGGRIEAAPTEMHRHDGAHRFAGPPVDDTRQRFRRHQPGHRIDIGKHDLRPFETERIGACQEGDGRHDHAIARLDAQRQRRDMQRCGAAGTGDGMRRID
jgi:hypothetical protein